MPDNELEITWQQSIAYFVAQETAFYLDGAWTIENNIYSEGAAPDLRDYVKYVPYPAVSDNGSTVELKVGTPLSLSAKLKDDPDMLDGAITFFKFWFSEEGAKQWILLCSSPMGIYVDLSTLEGVDPGLLGHLGAQDSAQTVYTLPATPAVVERGWDDCQSGLDTLLAGGSVDDAMATYQNVMSKYNSVTGTEEDPQSLRQSISTLESAGVIVCDSNSAAARLTAMLVSGAGEALE